jgi:hypothetical protein
MVAALFYGAQSTKAQVRISDIGSAPPTPGPDDIVFSDESNVAEPPGLNYYSNGGGYGYPGQVFTTGNNANGYLLNSLAFATAGNGGGGVTSAQAWTVRVYQISATSNATFIASFESQPSFTFFEEDWLQFTNITTGLQPNTTYAYTVANDAQGYEEIGAELGNNISPAYTNGEAVLIPASGGQLTTNNFSTYPGYDGIFDVGLSPITSILVNPPSIAPFTAVSNGTPVTITSGAVFGATPINYQWQTDGGSGGTLTNIPGANSSALAVNTTPLAHGIYQYDLVVQNASGYATSSIVNLTITFPTVSANLTDLGTSINGTPSDIRQLVGGGDAGGNSVDGLNYYDNNTTPPGETFTTGTNAQGYVINSIGIQTYLGPGGASSDQTDPYYLFIYTVNTNTSRAVLLQEYTNANFTINNVGDWIQWTGLSTPLAPNSVYAYAFGNAYGISGNEGTLEYAELNASYTNNLYSGGEIGVFEPYGGVISWGNSHNATNSAIKGFAGVFDIGMTAVGQGYGPNPFVNPITVTPQGTQIAGTQITLTEQAYGASLTYIWQTDGGSGGALTNIPANNQSNLVLNTAGWQPGAYNYDVIITNSYGSETSAVATVTLLYANGTATLSNIGTNPPTPGALDIYQTNEYAGANTPPGLNYYENNTAAPPGETFTTGGNPRGYDLNSVAVELAGNDAYADFPPDGQTYYLYIYSVNTTTSNATQYAVFVSSTDFVITMGVNDAGWLKWSGFSVLLQPNATYAYTFIQGPAIAGYNNYDDLASLPNTFGLNGEAVLIPPGGGPITYNTGNYVATFDLGLIAAVPTVSIIQVGSQVKLQWSAGSTLYSATSLLGPWTPVSATSPYTVSPTGPQKFYRAGW